MQHRNLGNKGPIAGTKRRQYLEENMAAIDVTLTPKDLSDIDEAAPPNVAAGRRYHPVSMKMLNG